MTMLAISAIRHRGCPIVFAVVCRSSLMTMEGSVARNVKFVTNDPQNPVVELGVHATVN